MNFVMMHMKMCIPYFHPCGITENLDCNYITNTMQLCDFDEIYDVSFIITYYTFWSKVLVALFTFDLGATVFSISYRLNVLELSNSYEI